ncbi:SurA N-terminal domain-containing protein [Thermodesulfovibrionales bacterium]|nr:SurA N-terminal domain-containing protein [Thermodesulfovibrionales bacterium]
MSAFSKAIKCILFLIAISYILNPVPCSARIIDRVVASVDDSAITLSEFQEEYMEMRKIVDGITREEVINSMINRLLLINEARRMRLEAPTHDELLMVYIGIRIKPRIVIREKEITEFYRKHIDEFKGKDPLLARSAIERHLFEVELSEQLKRHLEQLRADAEIRRNHF